MLYQLAHILRDRFPYVWDVLGCVLSCLFALRYDKQLAQIPALLKRYQVTDAEGHTFCIECLTQQYVKALVDMLAQQPEEAFTYFKPHGFAETDIKKLIRDKGFLAFVVLCEHRVVGYVFQRSFFWGKCYRGYLTDYRWRRKGINVLMNRCAADVAALMGMRVWGTIAPDNVASMRSAQAACDVRIVQQLDSGDYLVEYLPKNPDD